MMVVVRPRTLVGDEERTVTRTVDVRLEKGADGWTVSELASTGGEPPVSPAVTPTGEAALANPNLELSDTARWDIEAGRIRSEQHTSELQSLTRISYAVCCLKKKKTKTKTLRKET